MTQVNQWLQGAQQTLAQADILTARLDALLLAEDVTGKDRAWLLAHPEQTLTGEQLHILKNVLSRRTTHEPMGYIRGKVEFYGREFLLTPDVLIPRPETEMMIDVLKELVLSASQRQELPSTLRLADVGTGSGALGITAQLEVPAAHVDLLDVSPTALEVAQMNVDKFTMPMKVSQRDLVDGVTHEYDILLCNLPYVPDDYEVNMAARHEPKLALFGGSDGLDLYRKLYRQIEQQSKQPLYILCEALPVQHAALTKIALSSGYTVHHAEGFIQVFRHT